MDLITLRNECFDEHFNIKTSNIQKIKLFCDELKNKTGIQCCNHEGYLLEHVEKVYNGVINEMQKTGLQE